MNDDYQIIKEMSLVLTPEEILAWLQDGEALLAAGVTDQAAVEEAHYIFRRLGAKGE